MARFPELQQLPHLEAPAFQRLEWRFQRVGWALLAILVAVALTGLLGNGPLSKATAAATDGSVRIEFERFLHAHRESKVKIEVRVPTGSSDRIRLALDDAWLDAMTIRQITPLPAAEQPGSGESAFLFDIAGRRAEAPVRITLHFEPETYGPLSATLRIDDSDPIHLRQFVYP
jgi:hypothetical protein